MNKFVGGHEVGEARLKLLATIVTEAFDGRVLDCSVHALDLTVGPRMVGLGQSMLDPVGLADHVKAHLPGIGGVAVPGLVGELDVVIGQDRVDPVWNDFEEVFQKLPSGPPVGLLDQLSDGELAGAVDCTKR